MDMPQSQSDLSIALWADLDNFQWQLDDHLLYPLPEYPPDLPSSLDSSSYDDASSYSPSVSVSPSSSPPPTPPPTYVLPQSTHINAHLPGPSKPRPKRTLKRPLPDPDPIRPKRRRNNPIPLPVPVPNLTKKSRGRKVPRLAPAPVLVPEYAYDPHDGTLTVAPQVFFEPVKLEGGPSAPPGKGARTYMCEVDGCGKCFVRGEHLKRHVRSIHTHEKPHPCPYEGCDKSFSRRDNLGQHVRVHL